MRGLALLCGMGLFVAFALAGCIPTPGPGDYAAASSYRAQQAQEHAATARRDQAVADLRASHGDTAGAAAAQAEAASHSRAAGMQQFQANKDSWLSGF